MSLQDRKNKILPMVLVDLANSNPKQPFDRLALFDENGNPITPGQLSGGGATGPTGAAGKSAYQVWLDAGNTGNVNAYLASLKGAKGDPGNAGADGAAGKSAYQVWLDAGNTGDVNAYLASLKGVKGDPGDPSNVELGWADKTDANFVGTASAWAAVSGLSITITEGTRPYLVTFFAGAIAGNVLNNYVYGGILEGGAPLAIAQSYITGVANTGDAMAVRYREKTPQAGRSRTFVAGIGSGSTLVPTLVVSATEPSSIQALQV